jgi:hypothetical protein
MKHDVVELLPYYANGTLDTAERARVEAELATCPSCAEELRELERLGGALNAYADAAPAVPPSVLDDALARIATPPSAIVATRLRTAWWGTPARYATAAVLVVGFGVAAAAAYHAREAQVTQMSATTGNGESVGSIVYRVTPGPNLDAAQSKLKAAPESRAAAEQAADAASTVAKQHRLAKTARIDVLVASVETSLKRVRELTGDNGGELTSLDDASPRTAGAVHGAQLTVEVPAARLEATLDQFAALGTVQNRAIDAEDVDAAIVDEEARLRNLRSEENDLRALMAKGGKVDDILSVQQNLSDVRGQIEQLDATHQHDLHRVATSTISVNLTEERANETPAQPGPSARIDGAWQSGLNALADTVVSLLSTIAWCVAYSPVVVGVAAIGYAAARLLKRRFASA